MANRKDNLKALFSNTRTRVIIVFTAILLIAFIGIGISKLRGGDDAGPEAKANVSYAPAGIQSIPGMLDPTPEYAALQEKANIEQAEQAKKTGTSAIPTIIRSQQLGEGAAGIGTQTGQGSVGFRTLAQQAQEGAQKNLWFQNLQSSQCSMDAMKQVLNQGATLEDLKQGCSCLQLKNNGYGAGDLQNVCSCGELKNAGFSARDLKDAGFSAKRLYDCGFSACETRGAGFSAQEMKDGGYSDGELQGAGFSNDAIQRASGLPPGITADDVRKAGCDPLSLERLRAAGVTAAAIVRISGCTAKQLKDAGFSAADLKNAGFSAAQLKNAGFTPDELKKAGYSARDLLNAGYTPKDLADAGFTPAEIAAAERELPPGITAQDVRQNGCDVNKLKQERLAGVSALSIHEYAGCSAKALKAAGFSDDSLKNAGFTPKEIADATPVSDSDIKAAGCDANKVNALLQKGVSAKRIRELNGCSAKQLRAAGYGVNALKDAGFSPQELADAGFTPAQLEQAGINPVDAIANGRGADCSVDSLRKAREAGVSALTIKRTLGCSAKAMRAAGYSAKDLKDAGFSAAQLKDAGFDAKALKDAGFSAADLKNAGFDAKALKDAGFNAADLKNAGFNAAQLKAAGFSAKDLKDAGFSRKQLKAAGFNDNELDNAGFKPVASAVAGLDDRKNQQEKSSVLASLPTVDDGATAQAAGTDSNQQLQNILKRQQQQMAEQRYQSQIQQRSSQMVSAAQQSVQAWKKVPVQAYAAGDPEKTPAGQGSASGAGAGNGTNGSSDSTDADSKVTPSVFKAGDIIFAVIDTSINSDQPGPILATVVSGRLKGAKLIGSFNLPSNADKMVISFNTMSVPGQPKSTSISAVAIDANTARTALSSRTDKHYLLRYGSLFASSFLEGFGNAFQSANTTVQIGGTGGGDNITIQEGINRSALENAVIGLATLGKQWGQQAQQIFNTPTTVEVFSGTGIGVLFTQDLASL